MWQLNLKFGALSCPSLFRPCATFYVFLQESIFFWIVHSRPIRLGWASCKHFAPSFTNILNSAFSIAKWRKWLVPLYSFFILTRQTACVLKFFSHWLNASATKATNYRVGKTIYYWSSISTDMFLRFSNFCSRDDPFAPRPFSSLKRKEFGWISVELIRNRPSYLMNSSWK